MFFKTDSQLKSFVPASADSHFPIQNLPYGVFQRKPGGSPRIGTAIGDQVVDLSVLEESGLLHVPNGGGRHVFSQNTLNDFLALGRKTWFSVRESLTNLLREDVPTLRDNADIREMAFVPQKNVVMLMPAEIGDYTDFYSSRDHATNVGTMIRGPENALQPNWLHLPVAYHGRSSSIVVSGRDLHRPYGQTKKPDATAPEFGPSKMMDFELEMGFFVGPGNELGQPIAANQAAEHILGMVIVNDWSARDIQTWEYVPLGPFLAKNFGTSISPWIVTLDALAPFRTQGPKQDPAPMQYLQTKDDWTYDIQLEVWLQTQRSDPHRITASNAKHLYWNICQQLAHHTINGCPMRPGDMLASGTISGPEKESRGCMLELTWRGTEPIAFPNGETRKFLEDGDRVTMTGWCQGNGYRVGFGEVTGQILPAIERPL